ncbi:MAG: hypothetical protein ACD_62C00460G0011 [uncultured bacterium]|nr:MAG: hypothetical protein ACD_62C00460G0011 [uncultured bacterium]
MFATLLALACAVVETENPLSLTVTDEDRETVVEGTQDVPYEAFQHNDTFTINRGCVRPVALEVEASSDDPRQILDVRAYVATGNDAENPREQGYSVLIDGLVNYGYTDILDDGTYLWEIRNPYFSRTVDDEGNEESNTWSFEFDPTSSDFQPINVHNWTAQVFIRAQDQYREDIYNEVHKDTVYSDYFAMELKNDESLKCP